MSDLDAYREQLRQLREELARRDELVEERARIVDEARRAGMTVREAALLLGLTETGLRKAQRSYERRQDAPTALAS